MEKLILDLKKTAEIEKGKNKIILSNCAESLTRIKNFIEKEVLKGTKYKTIYCESILLLDNNLFNLFSFNFDKAIKEEYLKQVEKFNTKGSV